MPLILTYAEPEPIKKLPLRNHDNKVSVVVQKHIFSADIEPTIGAAFYSISVKIGQRKGQAQVHYWRF